MLCEVAQQVKVLAADPDVGFHRQEPLGNRGRTYSCELSLVYTLPYTLGFILVPAQTEARYIDDR